MTEPGTLPERVCFRCRCFESCHETVEYRGDKSRACLNCDSCKRFVPDSEPGTLPEGIERILPHYVRHDYGCDTQHGGSRCECDVAWQIERLHTLARQVLEAGAAQERPRTLREVEAEIEKHLYTNTKNGNRQAMLNIVSRLRATRTPPPPEAQE